MMIPLDWMPPLMFGGLIVFMIIGYPVAFSLCAVGFFFGFLAIEMNYFTMAFMQAIPGRVFGSILSNELLLAIPFVAYAIARASSSIGRRLRPVHMSNFAFD